jgi:hypothetical protein
LKQRFLAAATLTETFGIAARRVLDYGPLQQPDASCLFPNSTKLATCQPVFTLPR